MFGPLAAKASFVPCTFEGMQYGCPGGFVTSQTLVLSGGVITDTFHLETEVSSPATSAAGTYMIGPLVAPGT